MSFVTYADSENESEFGSAEMEMESTRSTPPHFADQDLKLVAAQYWARSLVR